MREHHPHREHVDGRDGFAPGRLRGSRGPRVFAPGDLILLLLPLIAEQPCHGYDLIRQIGQGKRNERGESPRPKADRDIVRVPELLVHIALAASPIDGTPALHAWLTLSISPGSFGGSSEVEQHFDLPISRQPFLSLRDCQGTRGNSLRN